MRALREGHELGNHSWMHSYFQNFYRTDQQQSDVERSTRLIQELSGSDAEPLYRPPVGLKSPPLARVAHARKLTVVAWSLHSRDTMARDSDATAARVLSRIAPGDIVLMHDGHERDDKHRASRCSGAAAHSSRLARTRIELRYRLRAAASVATLCKLRGQWPTRGTTRALVP